METKVKVNGFENTKENNEILRRIVKILFPLTNDVQCIEVGKEFSVIPFNAKTKDEIAKDIERLMQLYSEHPF